MDSALERSQGGLGIGLSLVKGLVEMDGGSVAAHSEGLGKGSEFTVRLPELGESFARETPRPPGGEKVTASPRKRILVADDNRDAADSLALVLRLAGHEVHAAHDGQEEDKRRASEAGFDHHLTKPVDPGALEMLLGGLPKPMNR